MGLKWLEHAIKAPSEEWQYRAQQRQNQLTKPQGSLGLLEYIAVNMAAMQETEQPLLENIHISVFAADHGVVEEGVSLFPQSVTTAMVKNFSEGGAAISVLAQLHSARLEVIDVGIRHNPEPLEKVISMRVASGTRNMAKGAAMTMEELVLAMQAGREAADRASLHGAQLFIGGEMGIGNTTSATALACAILEKPALELTGPGTGLDSAGVTKKAAVIERALSLHQQDTVDPLKLLRTLGGFEIVALAAAYVRCAQLRLPVLVDGFICSAAALIATRLSPDASQWWFYAHTSAEPGHAAMMQALHARPLLNLGMRLGEGSGAAVAVSIMRSAVALHNNMATFAEADVAESLD